jgi:transcriptional regulator with XRE-family HTH domain
MQWLSCKGRHERLAYMKGCVETMTPPAQLRQIRESLGVTQETVARRTRIGLRTYIRAEGGGRVTHGTATQILNAINELLAEAGRGPVTLDDLGLNLY